MEKNLYQLTISEEMVGHKLGEFSPTRQFFGHTPADKKAKDDTDNNLCRLEKPGKITDDCKWKNLKI